MAIKKPTSIKDVAREAGVSTALVSYVMNNKLSNRINKETAEKVRKVALSLNYVPNRIAQSLKLKKTFSIGLLVADIANPFSSYLARFMEDELSQRGYTLLIGSSDEKSTKFKSLVDIFYNQQVDGFIIGAPEGTENVIAELQSKNVPFVMMDRYFPNLNFNSVTVDNFEASKKAVEELIKSGRDKIGIVGYVGNLQHLNDRIDGAVDAFISGGLSSDNYSVQLVHQENIAEDIADAIDHLTEGDFAANAIFFSSNKLAIAGLKILMAKNISMPEKISILTFDQSDVFDLFKTPVSCIQQPLEQIAQESVTLLLSAIQDPEQSPQQIVLPTSLYLNKKAF